MARRGYKFQEFVAHAAAVKCLSLGKKSSRLVVSGGDDHKVNLWAIGKPNPLLSLSGHSSSVESVTFDSAEVLVVSGASTGAIKLWDLEEAKIVRTLTGHRSHCNTLEFHPFGEFFASGSSDTDLKIWDVRKKGCIHTYKGHTRGVSTIRFTPDGRWVVSGGADSIVKVWDLTAGKLLHELKFHEGQIQCLDFHPLEFLLATGSADRTVNFWDLETFELIGSAGPEATGVQSMTFHPDGKTLFCGLEDSLKVFSWEPIICHDAVDMGWSTLGDLTISEGKLLGCSYYRNCVGVWVADLSVIGPYGAAILPQSNSHMERKVDIQETQSAEKLRGLVRSATGLRTSDQDNETAEIRNIYVDTSASKKVTPKRLGSVNATKVVVPLGSSEVISPSPFKKKPETEVHTRSNNQVIGRHAVTTPVIVPRTNPNGESALTSRRESMTPESTNPGRLHRPTHTERTSNSKCDTDTSVRAESRGLGSKMNERDSSPEPKFHFSFFVEKSEALDASDINHKNIRTVAEKFERILSPDASLSSNHETCAAKPPSSSKPVNERVRLGRTRSLVEKFEKREVSSKNDSRSIAPIDGRPESHTPQHISKGQPQTSGRESMSKNDDEQKGQPQISVAESTSANDEDVMVYVMQNHDTFLCSLRSRLTKLQVVRHFWQRNDIKNGVNAVGKLPDHYVQADVVSVLMEKVDIVTLDLFSCLLPMVLGLLNSQIDRHTNVSLEILLRLVAIFGPVIRSTMSATPSVGVDLQADRRRDCCTQCFMQLQKIKQVLPSVTRRGGLIAKSAQELNLVLQDS